MLYQLFNGPKNTTAAFVPVNVSTLKTILQIKPLVPCKIIEWGFSGNAYAAAAPGTVELIETDVAATVTAFVAADITAVDGEALWFNSGDPTSSYISVGTSASGYTASAEGSITTVRNLCGPQQIAPTTQFLYQIPLDQEPILTANKFTRIRAAFGSTVGLTGYVKLKFL